MPFYAVPRVVIDVTIENGITTFGHAHSSVVSYRPSERGDTSEGRADVAVESAERKTERHEKGKREDRYFPKVRALQQLPTGESLPADVWKLEEVRQHGVKCVPGVRFFRVAFHGDKFKLPGQAREATTGAKDNGALLLYHSIVSHSRVRFSIEVEDGELITLPVDLSYRVKGCDTKPGTGAAGR